MSEIRVRMAPSPTGKLHIGTARTTLFNYLFAKKNKGKFILRFEDTDQSRSTLEFEKEITKSLKWLGLNWDERPFSQMERLDIYKKKAEDLEEQELIYRKDDALWLDAKKVIDKFKVPYESVKAFSEKDKKEKRGYLISLPEEDLILGKISANVEDFVIIRRNGIPTYHFAVVVDDEDMKITHVIRGQDHFSNTPKHYLLQKALGYKTPRYAHIPLTLNPDKTKLSKRKGDVAVSDYRNQGYLPEALINFMVLLGWHPGESSTKEIFTLQELEKEFSIEHMGKSPAVFDINKLNDLNAYYIRQKTAGDLLKIIRENKELNKGLEKVSDQFLKKVIEVEKTRVHKLTDLKEFDFYFKEPDYKSEILIFKKSDKEKTKEGLRSVLEILEAQKNQPKNVEDFDKLLKESIREKDLSFGDVFWPVRVALSGREASPSPAELLWVLGKEKSLKRIQKAIKLFK